MICRMSRSVLIKGQTVKKVSVEVNEHKTDNNSLYALLLLESKALFTNITNLLNIKEDDGKKIYAVSRVKCGSNNATVEIKTS